MKTTQRLTSIMIKASIPVIFLLIGFAAGKFLPFFQSEENEAFPKGTFVDSDTIDQDQIYGRWRIAKNDPEKTKARDKLRARLKTNPYLQGYQKAPEEEGVTLYDYQVAQAGLNLFTSGHGSQVFLMDMEGRILHTWNIPFSKVWPAPLPFDIAEEHKQFVRRARLFPNGDLLAVFEYIGIVKVDKDSNILWSYAGQNHHDLQITPDGRIYTLAHKVRYLEAQWSAGPIRGPLGDDYIEIFSPDGKSIRRISIFDAFNRSEYASFLELIPFNMGNVLHTNTVFLIEEPPARNSDIFRKGDILISLRGLNAIAVIDPETETIRWAMRGFWRRQHQPVLLPEGTILLLDNQGGSSSYYYHYNRSRVLEFDPGTQKIVWEYRDQDNGFFTKECGFNQRLANGNTLITESTAGRAFEVTPDGRIVWEYLNPRRAGKNQELIATLHGMTRIDPGSLNFLAGNIP